MKWADSSMLLALNWQCTKKSQYNKSKHLVLIIVQLCLLIAAITGTRLCHSDSHDCQSLSGFLKIYLANHTELCDFK